ncbi:hypothetical protein CJ030_MR8G002123 [Morella rubra]|uniref:Uncharacterized protein n=1 Tax=Morella rubra TaxID=262757 RepID=A0A6A1UUE3_9ROSI|nr:hypothetical protein CJ030_MR8G002123 [Morella rubra]
MDKSWVYEKNRLRHQLLNVGEVGHVESVWRRVLGPGPGPGNYQCISRRESVEECLPLLPPYRRRLECGRGFLISVNKWADVPIEVKEYIMDQCWTTSTLTTPHEDVRTVKNQESSNINPVELYKKNYTNKDGIWEGARDFYHQLAKARDEIEAMRAAREKDLQEFVKKQAKMEATLRDHREEQRVEQERIRLEQEVP